MPPPSPKINKWVMDKLVSVCRLQPPVAQFLVEEHAAEATVPFLARYRQDRTGQMSEHQVRRAFSTFEELTEVDKKRGRMMAALSKQNIVPEESVVLRLLNATTIAVLDEIFEPFKLTKESKASVAIKKGYDKIADTLLNTEQVIPKLNAQFRDPEERELLLAIVQHTLNQFSAGREIVKETIWKHGYLSASHKAPGKLPPAELVKWTKAQKNLKNYESFQRSLVTMRGFHTMALLRGESKGFLKLKFSEPDNTLVQYNSSVRNRFRGLSSRLNKGENTTQLERDILTKALELSYVKGALKAAETSARRRLKTVAHEEAINLFVLNVTDLLLQRPLGDGVILAIDPGFKIGCKSVILDNDGNILHSFVLPNPGGKATLGVNRWDPQLLPALTKYNVKYIVIGNGTGSRESEKFISPLVTEWNKKLEMGQLPNGPNGEAPNRLSYSIVSETGASVYSASAAANEELGHLDILFRGAVSIGRRLQNPLSELVKIPPLSIGVGMYQHDIDEKKLGKALTGAVGSAVCAVGIDVNKASKYLLRCVPGISAGMANKITSATTPWTSRAQLLASKALSGPAYRVAAGFLKIPESDEPLDNTQVHPEAYNLAGNILTTLNLSVDSRSGALTKAVRIYGSEEKAYAAIAEATGADGPDQVRLILRELVRPSPDPRDALPHSGIFREEMVSLADLKIGDKFLGVIENVAPFGAFVDIGIEMSPLIVRLTERERSYLSVGKVVNVRVLEIQDERRVSLSLILPDDYQMPPAPHPEEAEVIATITNEAAAMPSSSRFTKTAASATAGEKRGNVGRGSRTQTVDDRNVVASMKPFRSDEEMAASRASPASRFGRSSYREGVQEEGVQDAHDGYSAQHRADAQKLQRQMLQRARTPGHSKPLKENKRDDDAEEEEGDSLPLRSSVSPKPHLHQQLPRFKAGERVVAQVLQEKDGQCIVSFSNKENRKIEGRSLLHERQYKDLAGSRSTFQKLDLPARGTSMHVKIVAWTKTTDLGNQLYEVELDRAYYTTPPGAEVLKKLSQKEATNNKASVSREKEKGVPLPTSTQTRKKDTIPPTSRGKRNRDDDVDPVVVDL